MRATGFSGLGYEIKQILESTIFRNCSYSMPSPLIYQEIVISRPLQLARFVDIMIRSPVTQHLSDLT